MQIIRDGKVVWTYAIPGNEEYGDCTRLSNGNIVFSRRLGASEITPDKKIVWNYDAPPRTEIHTAQPVGRDRILIMQNGDPAKAMLMNKKTGINQLQGGIAWGISFALLEESHIDPTHGLIVNRNIAEYHVPVNADIGEIDVACLNIPDYRFSPLGARGIGEIGITGAAAAVANAIYNATGKRVRDFPITVDKLMA